jgi:iron complex transport system permease protein
MKLATPILQQDALQRKKASKARRISSLGVFLLLMCLLLFSMLVAVSFGSTSIPLTVITQILLNGMGIFHFTRQWDPSAEIIVWQVRMPVVVGAALVGAGLSVAGVLFQGMLRNPLADPYLIGTSSGASLGAAIAFVLPFDTIYGSFFPITPVLAFIGAIATVLFVYAIARVDGRTPVVTLLLAGVVINSVLIACQTLVLILSPRAEFTIQALFNWLSGGVEIASWSPLVIVGPIIVVGIVLAVGVASILDVFALGEEGAAYLGLRVERRKLLIVLLGSLLTAAAVSISGLIGFVGLVVPHVMRLLLGPRHHLLIPTSALGGAIFLTLSDLLARVVIAPAVLPVGVFTALAGAPFFLFVLRRSKREYQW